MIRDKNAKRYIYKAQPAVDAKRLEELLAAIRDHGRKLTNRTHLHPELANWKKPMPMPEPPIGKVFVLDKLNSISADVSLKYIEGLKPNFVETILQRLSSSCSVRFAVNLPPPPPPSPLSRMLTASMVIEAGKIYLAADSYWCEAFKPNPSQWLAAYQKIIESGTLPLRVTYVGGNYKVEHTAHGEILRYKKREGFPPAITGATLPGLSVGGVLDRFKQFIHQPGLKPKNARWRLDFENFIDHSGCVDADPLEVWRECNRLGFSGNKAEATFWWHLRDYSMFSEMPLMTEALGEPAGQSLLEFEFGDGKKCQLDVLCDKKGKYHLMFSFDGIKDHEELASLLKIKLKKWD